MADTDATNQTSSPNNSEERKGFWPSWVANVGAGVTVLALIVAAYDFGHKTGVDEGSGKYQTQIDELHDKIASATTAATLSEGNLRATQDQLKQWQDAYKTLTTNDQQIVAENVSVKEQLKQLDPCAYMEREIDSIEASMRWTTDPTVLDGYRSRRDRIQEQLTTCRH